MPDIVGTMIQKTFTDRYGVCTACDFFKAVQKEEVKNHQDTMLLLAKLMQPRKGNPQATHRNAHVIAAGEASVQYLVSQFLYAVPGDPANLFLAYL